MANRMTINYEKKPCYDIVFARDFSLLAEELTELGVAERKIAVILFVLLHLNPLEHICFSNSSR